MYVIDQGATAVISRASVAAIIHNVTSIGSEPYTTFYDTVNGYIYIGCPSGYMLVLSG